MRIPAIAALFASLLIAVPAPAHAATPTPAAAPAATPAPAPFDTRPARAALNRLAPGHDREVTFTALPKAGADTFRVTGTAGHIQVAGTSPAVLLTGFDWYLKYAAHGNITWAGERVPKRLPAPPAGGYTQTAVQHRFVLNDTNEGYTGPYWDWKRWEHEIDVLAAHGANEVYVTTGADAVYYDTFRKFGYSDREIRSWIPAPAHQPWWLLQNLCCHGGPVAKKTIDRRAALGRKIAQRVRELGMTPVLPGYYGTVPTDFVQKNPGAKIVPQGTWSAGYQRPDWLDPRDPAFTKVAAAFYDSQRRIFGDSTMYKMDLLHEGGSAGDVPVGAAAQAVEKALRTAHPGATWVILGWQTNPRKDLLTAVDRSKMLIVDGLSDRYATVTDRDKDWLGTPYTFGTIPGFGGRTTLGANTPDWEKLYTAWRDKPGSALAGTAYMPEGADRDPASFELFNEMAWRPVVDLASWFAQYPTWRYGAEDPHAQAAWRILAATAYGTTRGNGSRSDQADGLFDARPDLSAVAGTPYGHDIRYDAVKFDQALTELLKVAPALRNNSAYRYDVVDVARQAMSNRSRVLLPQIKAAYTAKDWKLYDRLTTRWLSSMTLLDRLLRTDPNFLLGTWLKGTHDAAAEYDARSILMAWGNKTSSDAGGLHDYANRELSGLVGGHYRDRWKTYFKALRRGTTMPDWFAVDDAWAHRRDSYPTRASGDAHRAAEDVLRELTRDPSAVSLTAKTDKPALSPVVLTATFTNKNGFAAARNVRLTGPGQPLTPTTFDSVAPGQTVTAQWKVTDGGDGVVTPLVVSSGSAVAVTRVLSPAPVQPPLKTVNLNDGTFAQRGDDFAIEGGGADLWTARAEFGAIYGTLGTTGTVSTRVTSQDVTGPYARAGIIVRNDLATKGSTGFVDLTVTPAHGCILGWDANGDGKLDTNLSDPSFSAPTYLRLTRSGGTYTGQCSSDGKTWKTIGTATPGGPAASQDAGLVMSAANGGNGVHGIATFHGLDIG